MSKDYGLIEQFEQSTLYASPDGTASTGQGNGSYPIPFYADQNGPGSPVQVNFGYGYDITANAKLGYSSNILLAAQDEVADGNMSQSDYDTLSNVMTAYASVLTTKYSSIQAAQNAMSTVNQQLLGTSGYAAVANDLFATYTQTNVDPQISSALDAGVFDGLNANTQLGLESMVYEGAIIGPSMTQDLNNGDIAGAAYQAAYNTFQVNNGDGSGVGPLYRSFANAALILGLDPEVNQANAITSVSGSTNLAELTAFLTYTAQNGNTVSADTGEPISQYLATSTGTAFLSALGNYTISMGFYVIQSADQNNANSTPEELLAAKVSSQTGYNITPDLLDRINSPYPTNGFGLGEVAYTPIEGIDTVGENGDILPGLPSNQGYYLDGPTNALYSIGAPPGATQLTVVPTNGASFVINNPLDVSVTGGVIEVDAQGTQPGSLITSTADENTGVQSSSVTTDNGDGSITTNDFDHVNGTGGEVQSMTVYDDGSTDTTLFDYNGGTLETITDPSGAVIDTIETSDDGSSVETAYNQDGSSDVVSMDPDGNVTGTVQHNADSTSDYTVNLYEGGQEAVATGSSAGSDYFSVIDIIGDPTGDATYQGGTFTPEESGSSWDLDFNQYGYDPGDGDLTIDPGNPDNDGSIDIPDADPTDLSFQADDANGDLTINDGTPGDEITVVGEFSTSGGATEAARAGSGTSRAEALRESPEARMDYMRNLANPLNWRSSPSYGSQEPMAAFTGTGGQRIQPQDSGLPVQQEAIGSIVTADGTIDTGELTFSWTGSALGSDYGNNAFALDGSTATVTGGSDSNTYTVAAGTGTTTIESQGTGTLALGFASYDPITYVAGPSGNLTITDLGTGQVIDVNSEYHGSGQATEPSIRYAGFSDGTNVDLSQVDFSVAVSSGSTIHGTGFGTDTFILATGTGTAIAGTETGDTFLAAAGNHAETGGAGQNAYDFAGGDGTLTITPGSGGNELDIGAGINEADVTYNADKATGNLSVDDAATGDHIVILADLGGTANDTTSKMQFINFANGTDVYVPGGVVSTNPVIPGTTYSGSNLENNLFVMPGASATINAGGQFNDYVETTQSSGVTINLAGTGRLDLGPGASEETTWFAKVGNNLTVEELGSPTVLTVDNWFNAKGDLATITTQDGSQIASAQITALVSSMGSYATAHGFNPATASVMPTLASLQNAIHADWH